VAFRWDMINGEPSLVQTSTRPSIYMDQWMWGLLSEHKELRERFITIVKKKNATIIISILNFLEFGKITDTSQREAIIEIMDSLDFAFCTSEPLQVIDAENKTETPDGGAFFERHPIVDRNLLNLLWSKSDALRPLCVSALLKDQKPEDVHKYRKAAESIANAPNKVVDAARADVGAMDRLKRKFRNRHILQRTSPPYTRDVYAIAVRFIVVNETMKMHPNEWIDLFHTVVPISYIDFVLLDRRWCNFIKSNLPLKPPSIARVYSQSDLDQFFTELEAFTE
jgi:hypothetical protein